LNIMPLAFWRKVSMTEPHRLKAALLTSLRKDEPVLPDPVFDFGEWFAAMTAFDAVEIGAPLQASDRFRSGLFQTCADLTRRQPDVDRDQDVVEHIKDAIGGRSQRLQRASGRVPVEPPSDHAQNLDHVPEQAAGIFDQVEPAKSSCFKR